MSDTDIPDEIQIDRELAKRGLLSYIRVAWPLVEPARDFISNWHIEAICEHLEAVSAGEIQRLVINVPPVCMKSLTTCVFWPTWDWTRRPEGKWIFASYAAQLSRRDALRSRRILESDWYQRRWGHLFSPRSGDEWTATKYANDKGGFRLSTSVAGMVTGAHADVQVCDDPIKPQDVTGSANVSKNALDKSWTWWNETMSTRLVNFKTSARVIIMQRLHENDLAGRVLKDDGYDHLCLPMEYDPKTTVVSGIGFEDPREEEGELLWPERFSEADVGRLKTELGSLGTAAQLQQLPAPRGGAIFKKHWIRYWYLPGYEHLASEHCVPLPQRFHQEVLSFDCAFKGGREHEGSKVGAAALGKMGASSFLLDIECESMDMPETLVCVKSMATRHPRALTKLIEDAANGPAVYSSLNKEVPGLILVPTGGGKIARANAVSPIVEAGNFHVPHPEMPGFEWVEEFLAHLTSFPSGSIDDDVDAVTHALVRLHLGDAERYVQAMMQMSEARRS